MLNCNRKNLKGEMRRKTSKSVKSRNSINVKMLSASNKVLQLEDIYVAVTQNNMIKSKHTGTKSHQNIRKYSRIRNKRQ